MVGFPGVSSNVSGLDWTKARPINTSLTTNSTTFVTVVEVTNGKGVAVLSFSPATDLITVNVKITIDGVVIDSQSLASASNTKNYVYGAGSYSSSHGNWGSFTLGDAILGLPWIGFKKNLKFEINNPGAFNVTGKAMISIC